MAAKKRASTRLFALALGRSPAAKAGRRAATRLVNQAVGGLLRSARQAGMRATRAATRAATKAARDAQRPPPGAGDWIAGLAVGPGGARRYRLYRPPTWRRGLAMPLVVMLHGCGQDARSLATSTRMNRLAAREGFLVLYPEQDRLAHPQGCWHWYDTDSGLALQEAALILQAIDQVALRHGADRTRVAIAGLSAGAGMAALLATRWPERFQALVMHSGVPPGLAHSTASALAAMQGRRAHTAAKLPQAGGAPWPPLLVIHGSADRVVSPANAHAAVALWAAQAGATARPPRRVQRGARHAMVVTDFMAGARTVAQLAQVEHLGHAWSGGTARQAFSDPQGPDASTLLWRFVARQFTR